MDLHRVLTRLPFAILFASFVGADTQGCQSAQSSAVDQNDIYSAYWLYYQGDEDVSYARAQFRLQSAVGTTLELSNGSNVTFQGTPLTFNQLLDWEETKVPGQVQTGTFVFTDTKGKQYENKISPYLPASVRKDFPDHLSTTDSFELVWDGEPLVQGETMEVIVANDLNRTQFYAAFEQDVGAKSVLLVKTELAKLPRGRSVVGLQRHHDYPLQNGTSAGGKITTTYQSANVPFTLE